MIGEEVILELDRESTAPRIKGNFYVGGVGYIMNIIVKISGSNNNVSRSATIKPSDSKDGVTFIKELCPRHRNVGTRFDRDSVPCHEVVFIEGRIVAWNRNLAVAISRD